MSGIVLQANNTVDPEGRPYGGSVSGVGIQLNWQEGPIRTGDHETPRNGAGPEDVLRAVLQRLEFFQSTPFACDENDDAIVGIYVALDALEARTARRTEAGIEGTWVPDHVDEPEPTETSGSISTSGNTNPASGSFEVTSSSGNLTVDSGDQSK